MAAGVNPDPGFLEASSATPGAGELEWASVSGVEAFDPIMSGGGSHDYEQPGYNVGRRFASISTLPASQSTMAASHYDNWRDLLDWKHSPAPWVLLLAIAAIGLVHLRVAGGVGPVRGGVAVG